MRIAVDDIADVLASVVDCGGTRMSDQDDSGVAVVVDPDGNTCEVVARELG